MKKGQHDHVNHLQKKHREKVAELKQEMENLKFELTTQTEFARKLRHEASDAEAEMSHALAKVKSEADETTGEPAPGAKLKATLGLPNPARRIGGIPAVTRCDYCPYRPRVDGSDGSGPPCSRCGTLICEYCHTAGARCLCDLDPSRRDRANQARELSREKNGFQAMWDLWNTPSHSSETTS